LSEKKHSNFQTKEKKGEISQEKKSLLEKRKKKKRKAKVL
jgi:hypothetical protein